MSTHYSKTLCELVNHSNINQSLPHAAMRLLSKAYPSLIHLLVLGSVQRLCDHMSNNSRFERGCTSSEALPDSRSPSVLREWAMRLLPK